MKLQCWKSNNVFTEVMDSGQHRISVRWVISLKSLDDKIITKARGFEEIQDFRKDFSTCSKESIRIAASQSWVVNSMDIKTAFLQGDNFDRVVYVQLLKEAEASKLWKLN